MKKLLVPLCVAASSFAAAQQIVVIIIDGKGAETRSSGLVRSGRSLVPIRSVAQGLGAEVDVDGPRIEIRRGNDTIVLTIGSRRATVNGERVALDQPALVRSGRTLVPTRFVAEAFGARVKPRGGVLYVQQDSESNPNPVIPASVLKPEIAIVPIVFGGSPTQDSKRMVASSLSDMFVSQGWRVTQEADIRRACDRVFGQPDPENKPAFDPSPEQLQAFAKELGVRYALFVSTSFNARASEVSASARYFFVDAQDGKQKRPLEPAYVQQGKAPGPVNGAMVEASRKLVKAIAMQVLSWLPTDESIEKKGS